VEPDFDARLTWPEADALRSLLDARVTVLVPVDPTATDAAFEVVLASPARTLRIVSTEVPTPHRDAPWLDVERPRVEQAQADEAVSWSQLVDVGRVREIAVFSTTVWWTPPVPAKRTVIGGVRLRRAMRSLRRTMTADDLKAFEERVAHAEASEPRPRLTLLDEAIELVGDRLVRIWPVGSWLRWAFEEDVAPDDGYTRHVIACSAD
jgi:hypothetical protein